ncbi:MAG TPA: nucleotidyltransferase family protein [Candidatus Ozemobacteraceae bacterium]|nr:nucleotidyltransferase family protein [Candidatus Ozemobacteraceae bacterium]
MVDKPVAVQMRKWVFETLKLAQPEWRRFGVKRLGVFGSVVRDEANSDSDVDILVEFERDRKNYDNFLDLAEYLERLMCRKVDLLTPEGLSPYLGPHILKEVRYVSDEC